MELNDIYDENRNLTGKLHRRGTPWKPGEYGVVVCVWVYDGRGHLLLTRRAREKSFAGTWENSGGAVKAGETSRQAASRETREELGFDPALEGVRPALTVNFSRGFDDLYLVERDVDAQKLRLQAEEVMDVRWAAREEVLQMIDAGAFIPYRRSLIELLFDMRGQMGMLPVPWPERT